MTTDMNDQDLPSFPRPDLPVSHPENYPTLRLRVRRQLGLPDDGRLWIHDALAENVLAGYQGIAVSNDDNVITLAFASLTDAAAWADAITVTGQDRSLVRFGEPPSDPYQAVTITVQTNLE